ncbi:hypothetical protein ACP4OV_015876 [Aristida adscensionis]
MAGGVAMDMGVGKDYPGKLTMFVLLACAVAATGGLIFGLRDVDDPMAPARLRGTLNIGFQLMITVGILCASLIDYGAAKIEGGALFLPDTPNSLIDRGHADAAKRVLRLRRVRGTDDVGDEYAGLVAASDAPGSRAAPWRTILRRRYQPQLAIAVAVAMFQQLTGMNVIMFYSPVRFRTLGFSDDSSLM